MKKGILYLNQNTFLWEVKEIVGDNELVYPVYFDHQSDKFLKALNNGVRINFILIDEFSHPELFKDTPFMEGTYKAKLIV